MWRERYVGGLTELEEDFARAMSSYTRRRKRRRRLLTATTLLVVATLALVFGVLWRQSELETRRAEAANLLSLAQLNLESYPSAALAYATESLEFSDSPEARRMALKALWKGPTAFVVNEVPSWLIAFSPDGRWLVQTTDAPPHGIHVIGADGSDELLKDVHDGRVGLHMGRDSGVFATFPWGNAEAWALWSAPEKRLLSKTGLGGWPDNTDEWPDFPGDPAGPVFDLSRRRVLLTGMEDDRFFVEALGFDGASERLGTLPFDVDSAARCTDAANGRWFEVSKGHDVYVVEFGDHDLSEPRRIEPLGGPVVGIECDPLGRFVAACYEGGEIRLWDLDGESPPRVIQGPPGITGLRITNDGSMLEAIKRENGEVQTWIWSLELEAPALLRYFNLGNEAGMGLYSWTLNPIERQLVSVPATAMGVRLWPLGSPADAEPVIMQRGMGASSAVEIHPSGGWLADSGTTGLILWPLARRYPAVINRYEEQVGNLVFGPEAGWLATSSSSLGGTVRLWQLDGDILPPGQIVHQAQTFAYGIEASPDGKRILLGTHDNGVHLLSLDGEPPRTLPGATLWAHGVAFSPDGRVAAAAGNAEKHTSSVIRVWDLASYEEVKVLDTGGVKAGFVQFTDGGHLLSGSRAGLQRWDLETGDSELLCEGIWVYAVTADGRRALVAKASTSDFGRVISLVDLETGAETPLETHGDRVSSAAFDAAGKIVVTGYFDGTVRGGPVTGEEPHMLLGHSGPVRDVKVDPLGRWIASASGTEIRLWPMPDLSKRPLHTLPHDELIAKLKTLTNLRVVRDEESATGWKLTHDPFPGWETVPTW